MVVKTTYDKINISFCVEQNKVSVLAEHLPKMPTASWEMYNDIGINYDFGEDYSEIRNKKSDFYFSSNFVIETRNNNRRKII